MSSIDIAELTILSMALVGLLFANDVFYSICFSRQTDLFDKPYDIKDIFYSSRLLSVWGKASNLCMAL